MRRAREVLLALFCLSLITSMAGMELFGWALFALALLGFVREPRTRAFLTQPVLLSAYALVAWVALGLWWNSTSIAKPWTGVAEMRWVLSLIGIAATFAAVVGDRRENLKIEKLIWPLTAVAVLISLYSISQYWTGADWLRGARSPLLLIEESRYTDEWRYRPYGLFKMTLTYACSYAMFGLLPFCLAFKFPKTGKKFWILQLCALIIFLSVFMTFSRGVWISLGVALVLLIWHLWRQALLFLPFVAVAVGAMALATSPVLRARVLSFADAKHESNSERMDLWRANLLMFKTHPVIGVGYEQNGPPTVDEYYRELGITSEFKSHAHSNYLNFLSGTGLPGFLFYMFFICGTVYLTWVNCGRYKNSDLYYVVVASLGAQIVLHVGGLTEYNFGDAEVQYQYLTYAALNIALYSRPPEARA